jgi:AcrR family transcriptional regulator
MKPTSEVRERIVATATRLFYQQGYNLTGINQIIAEADIARASLYQHFASKQELLLEYVRRADDAWFQALEDFSQACATPRDCILALFDFRRQRQQAAGYIGCSFVKINAEVERSNTEVFALVGQHKARLRSYVHALVAQAQPTAEAVEVDRLADTVFLLLEGGGISSTVQQDAWALTRAKELAGNLL